MQKTRIGLVVAWTFALALWAVPTPAHAGDSSPGPIPDSGSTIEDVFPDGLPPGAVALDPSTVSFDSGAALLHLSPQALSDCPSGWLCLWAASQFTGRMLQFQSTGSWQNLTNYGFNDVMSSWANKRSFDSLWAYNVTGGGTVRCMDSLSSSSYVGNTDNDKASSIRNLTTDTRC